MKPTSKNILVPDYVPSEAELLTIAADKIAQWDFQSSFLTPVAGHNGFGMAKALQQYGRSIRRGRLTRRQLKRAVSRCLMLEILLGECRRKYLEETPEGRARVKDALNKLRAMMPVVTKGARHECH